MLAARMWWQIILERKQLQAALQGEERAPYQSFVPLVRPKVFTHRRERLAYQPGTMPNNAVGRQWDTFPTEADPGSAGRTG